MEAPQLALPVHETHEGPLVLYRIVLPFLPPSKNQIDAWPIQWKQSAKKKWVRAIQNECLAQAVPLNVPKIGLAATLVFPVMARRDPQNYAQQLWHWVPDALQSAGVISGDHEGKITIGPNWGLTFQYDLRKHVPKPRRSRTDLMIAMRMP